jgi:hypothetical protein
MRIKSHGPEYLLEVDIGCPCLVGICPTIRRNHDRLARRIVD